MKPLLRSMVLSAAAIMWTSCAGGVSIDAVPESPPNGGSPDGGLIAPGADAGSSPGDADAGPVADAGPAADAGTSPPNTTATLLEPGAMRILSVSPDATRVLISHHQLDYSNSDAGDLSLVTLGQPTRALVPHGTVWASFSPDGRFFIYNAANTEPGDLNLGRADGTGLRQLTSKASYHGFSGRWLYYADESGPNASLYRLLPPDGEPQLLATFPPPQYEYGAIFGSPSPDGESVAYCHYPPLPSLAECFLLVAGSAMPLKLPDGVEIYPGWTADGKWLRISACSLVDETGAMRTICDASISQSFPSPDGKLLALFTRDADAPWPPPPEAIHLHLYSLATGADVVLPTPAPFDLGVYRPALSLSFTPDGSRLIALLGESSFSAATAGGGWTPISSDDLPMPRRGPVMVSPDSRVIADTSDSWGVVESVEGAPSRAAGPPGGSLVAGSVVLFEPQGGLGKALYVGPNRGVWLANADGSGPWLGLPEADECAWGARVALCARDHSDPLSIVSCDLMVATDDGQQMGTVAHDAIQWALTLRKLFYIPSAGGLYVLDVPQP